MMISAYKKCAVAVSTAFLALATPNMAVAQTPLPIASQQGISIEIVTEYFAIEITICVGQDC